MRGPSTLRRRSRNFFKVNGFIFEHLFIERYDLNNVNVRTFVLPYNVKIKIGLEHIMNFLTLFSCI